MAPSSFGMTFCVDGAAEAIKITAQWGHYQRTESKDLKRRDGEPLRVWKRTPRRGVSRPIELKAGKLLPWIPCREQEDVFVEGIIRKKDSLWIITLFLVNGQAERKKEKDSAWLFQAELIVEGSNNAPIFMKRPLLADYDRKDCGDEEQTMDMLYRKSLEFAVGHGVGVHWELAEGNPNRATKIQTKVIPAYEINKVTPPTAEDLPLLAGVELDMKVLAETAPADFQAKLGPLIVAYRAWIEKQEKRTSNPKEGLAEFKSAAKSSMERCHNAMARIKEGIDLLGSNPQVAVAFQFLNRAMWLQRIHTIYSELIRHPFLLRSDRPWSNRPPSLMHSTCGD